MYKNTLTHDKVVITHHQRYNIKKGPTLTVGP